MIICCVIDVLMPFSGKSLIFSQLLLVLTSFEVGSFLTDDQCFFVDRSVYRSGSDSLNAMISTAWCGEEFWFERYWRILRSNSRAWTLSTFDCRVYDIFRINWANCDYRSALLMDCMSTMYGLKVVDS